MATNLANINQLINDRRRDTGSNSIDMNQEGFRAVNTTLDYWNQMHDWEWQIDKTLLNYNEGITWYTIPARYKSPIDLRYYQNPRNQEFDMVSEASFDSETLKSRRFAVATLGQTEFLRVKTSGTMAQLHTLGDNTDGSTVITGAISNISHDSYDFFDLSSSITFDYSGTSGVLDIYLSSSVEISDFFNRSSIYWNSKFPSYTNWTSITLRVGDNASNYYTGSSTQDYLSQTPIDSQWNKHKVAWSDMTKVGSPSTTTISYVGFTIAYSVNPDDTGLRLENLFISKDIPLLFEHYKTDMVVAIASSTKTQNFTSTTTTGDQPLFSGKWDWVKEAFANSVLETTFWITGEYTDLSVAQNKVDKIVTNLKNKIPGRRRYPEMMMKFDIN